MVTIAFKAKPEKIYNVDETVAYQRVKVPALNHGHCAMNAMRASPKFGSYANSDLFLGILRRAVKASGIGDYIRLDQVPAHCTVDASGYLAAVWIEIEG